ncbi:MAG TPA: winged helix-turn-helix transcriptional regulator [Syntrophomonadaceae bacterium]|nr:winged helix-turn-helix transcriptional regulator [Syntrophomonadaceae bacterium]
MRLTPREREISDLIKKNPLISQDELAQICGITRSSIAVHISNLMKKGVIRGKGYVFNEETAITILGECFLEINIEDKGETNSVVEIEYRGLPIELSSVLCNYGTKPKVLTFIGNDDVGEIFLNDLQNLEIDTSNIFKHPSKRSCRRVYINNKLTYFEHILWEDYLKAISTKEWAFFNCDWLIVEDKFAEEITKRALVKKNEELPFFCTYILGNNIADIPDYLSYYSVVVIGVETINNSDIIINKLLELNNSPEQIFVITDGKSEILVIKENRINTFPLLPSQVFPIEDKIVFFLGGLIYGLLNNHPLRQAIRIAIGTV